MDEGIKNFIKVWILAILSLCYCYYLSAKIPRGLLRLLSILPVVYLFILLPFSLSSPNLRGPTAFFLVWLGNFKLLLFSFDQGPLSPPPSKLFHFISIACLPIKVKEDPPSKSPQALAKTITTKNLPYPKSTLDPPRVRVPKPILYGVKLLALVLIYHLYNHRKNLPKNVILIIYCLNLYLQLELVLALCATPAKAFLGFELEPQFNEPYLTTSLQDFWGRRWNLMVTRILHPAVYDPIHRVSTGIVGPRWAALPAVVAAFGVSGLMHEAIYYYLANVHPTWEVTWFFVLHGICVAIEVAVKKIVRESWHLSPLVSGPATVAFVAVTSFWLFFPQIVRNGIDEKVIREGTMFVDFVKGSLNQITLGVFAQ
ncbi:hypothetical protein SLEP1_g46599 [Rubroshorea leprosula]|uniref:Wax synthase domain-containing protein n=1 Tax=Rubroshorea leprosula TaxID=152421 RepID=A0AAV5LND4_9ROSI|nr:hypothetical protein SLEP1_g46599 [Rubroshorea leprosula]